jgi:hypothetical protein
MDYLVWIIAAIGLVAIGATFRQMKPGFGPFNIRALGIVLVATFAALLALKSDASLTAAMGILGAIAGYVFGIRNTRKEEENEDQP